MFSTHLYPKSHKKGVNKPGSDDIGVQGNSELERRRDQSRAAPHFRGPLSFTKGLTPACCFLKTDIHILSAKNKISVFIAD